MRHLSRQLSLGQIQRLIDDQDLLHKDLASQSLMRVPARLAFVPVLFEQVEVDRLLGVRAQNIFIQGYPQSGSGRQRKTAIRDLRDARGGLLSRTARRSR